MKIFPKEMIDELNAIARYFHMWSLLGWYDIKQRYRRSLIGPFWITISTGIMVGSIGLMFSTIFKSSFSEFLPYFAIGQIIWLLLAAQLTDACTMFVQSQSIIKQVSLPLSVHVLRKLWYNIILFLHNFLIIIIVLVIAGKGFSWEYLLIIPAIILILILLFLLSMILGIICTRFRDITQIVAVFLQLIYFFTPIFWMKKSLASKQSWITDFNPFFHIIELVRSPLLGKPPDLYHWISLLIYIVLAAAITFFFIKRFRNRVAYWL
ncbi:MAG: ABC transporter permease [Deltaproteobacteria bacterium HGW-Deltaproteobacteria-10]|nr:MAG: ABC transporter permease [Deltaproteobacteria bacterium HGW-Deltaproteobacteria-10]